MIKMPGAKFTTGFNIGHSSIDPESRIYYSDVIMGVMASQITSLTIVSSTVYSGVDERNQ